MKEEIPAEERFKRQIKSIIELSSDYIEILNENTNDKFDTEILEIVSVFFDSMDSRKLVIDFITQTKIKKNYWDEIRDENENFFLEHTSAIFGGLGSLGENYAKTFRNLFTARNKDGDFVIDKKERSFLWRTFKSLIKISINFIRKEREEDTCEFMEEIDVQQEALNFGMQ